MGWRSTLHYIGPGLMEIIGRVFAGIGAAMAGQPIDDYFRKQGEDVYEPGSAR